MLRSNRSDRRSANRERAPEYHRYVPGLAHPEPDQNPERHGKLNLVDADWDDDDIPTGQRRVGPSRKQQAGGLRRAKVNVARPVGSAVRLAAQQHRRL